MTRTERGHLIGRERRIRDEYHDVVRQGNPLVRIEQERRSSSLSGPEAGHFPIECDEGVVNEDNCGVRKIESGKDELSMSETCPKLPQSSNSQYICSAVVSASVVLNERHESKPHT